MEIRTAPDGGTKCRINKTERDSLDRVILILDTLSRLGHQTAGSVKSHLEAIRSSLAEPAKTNVTEATGPAQPENQTGKTAAGKP